MEVYHPVSGLSNVITRSTCSHLGVISVVSVQGAPGSAGVPLWVPAMPRIASHSPGLPGIALPRINAAAGDHKSRPYDRCGALSRTTPPRSQHPAAPRIARSASHCPVTFTMPRIAPQRLHCSAAPRSTPQRPTAPQRTSMPFATGDHKSRPCGSLRGNVPQRPAVPHIAPHCASMLFATGDHKGRPYNRCHAMGGNTSHCPTMPRSAPPCPTPIIP